MNFNQPALILFAAAAISLLLTIKALKARKDKTGKYLFLLLGAATLWSFFYGIELISQSLSAMKITLYFSYLGIVGLPVFWFLFALNYCGLQNLLNKFKIRPFLWILPGFILISVITNDFHHLFYKSVEAETFLDNYTFLKITTGPIWIINIVLSHILIFLGLIIFINLMFKLTREERIPVVFFLTSAVFPYIFNLFYLFGIKPYGFLDLTPIGFIFMGGIVFFGISNIELFSINPLAVNLFFINTTDSIFILNKKRELIETNPAASELLKTLPNEEFWVKSKKSNSQDIFCKLLESNHEIIISDKTFQNIKIEIPNKKGSHCGFLYILRDITVERDMQEKLKSLNKLQSVLIGIASKYINIRIDEVEKTINESLTEIGMFVNADRSYIFDYNWEEQNCSNTFEWCNQNIAPEIDNLQNVPVSSIPEWVKTHKQGNPMVIPDVFILPKDSNLRQILEPQNIKSLITIPVMDKAQCTGFIGFDFVRKYHQIFDDELAVLIIFSQIILNLKKRELLEKNLIAEKERADAANKAKSEFLANMSHEIRTPLNSILGYSEIIYNTTDDSKHKNYLLTILENGKTLLALINDILDLSKIEANQLKLINEPVSLISILNEMYLIFKPKVEEKNIELIFETDPILKKTLLTDEIRMRQILLNLIGNAVKFTNHGYVKVISKPLEIKNGSITFIISIKDTGIGISKEESNRIFESFNQAYGQKNRKYEGTGLGLAITKKLIELMNGTIGLESEFGKGSNFYLIFNDMEYSDSTFEQTTPSFNWQTEEYNFNNSKILIVDDILHNRELVVSYLKPHNLHILEAQNGTEAIEKTNEYKPDIILMDIKMPGLSGTDATKIIKRNTETAHIPVLALTASVLERDKAKIKEIFNGLLLKPIQKNLLLKELIKYLPYSQNPAKDISTSASKTSYPEKITMDSKSQDLFTHKFLKEIEAQTGYMIPDELSLLSDQLEAFAKEKKINSLLQITRAMRVNLEEFNFDKIQQVLKILKKITQS
jgi:signal transduction histidine kinase/DNA-binding response OmpR family regulator